MKTKKARVICAGVIGIMLLAGLFSGCTSTTQTSTEATYTDYTVTAGELKNTLSLEGYLTPAKTVAVTADQTSKVAKILKTKGKVVSKGTAIVQLENGNYVYAPAKGKITSISVAVGDRVDSTVTVGTMYDYSTKTTTSSGGMGGSTTSYSSVDISTSATTYVSAVDVAVGDTVAAGDKLVELENGNFIYATTAGLISQVDVAVGDKVDATTAIASIVDNSNFYISVSVNEIDAQTLKVGQSVDVTINALDKQVTGTVSEISVEGTVSSGTTKFTVNIALDEQNASYRTNMSAQVDILIDDVTDAVMVPIDAVTTVNGTKTVMKKDTSTSAYTATTVETGISNDSYVQITSGLSAGDVVGVANSSSTGKNSGMMGGGDMSGTQMLQGGSQGAPQGGGQGGPQS